MRAVIQRVKRSSVTIDSRKTAEIGYGLLVLIGIAENDGAPDAEYMAEKLVHLRVFEDESGKMNRSLIDIAGHLMLVSQFTLMGDCRKGRRPSFAGAKSPEAAEPLYRHVADLIRNKGIHVQTGVFGAMMDIELINDGPVTLILESP